jgi:hypothetical protein
VFFRNADSLENLCEFITHTVSRTEATSWNDMQILAEARKAEGHNFVDALPSLPSWHNLPLQTPAGQNAIDPEIMTRHFDQIGLVFDAAAIGQYLGGPDPSNFNKRTKWYHRLIGRQKKAVRWPGPGYINPETLFNPSFYNFEWHEDERARRKPMMVNDGRSCEIANLHIHSKKLEPFMSA